MEAIQVVLDRDYLLINPAEYQFCDGIINLRNLTIAGVKMFHRMQQTRESLNITRVRGFENNYINDNISFYSILVETSKHAGKYTANAGNMFLKCYFYDRHAYRAGLRINNLAVYFLDPTDNEEKIYMHVGLHPPDELVFRIKKGAELSYISYLESVEVPVGLGNIKLPLIHSIRRNEIKCNAQRVKAIEEMIFE